MTQVKKGNLKKKNKKDIEIQNEQSMLEEVVKNIDNISEMRFIEKISRPIEKRAKQQYVQKFAGKMDMLHIKLRKIQKQLTEKSTSQGQQQRPGRSVLGSMTNKPIDWKKLIRTIQIRYLEVFYEGSFKHYKKLFTINAFVYKLEPIDIEGWATTCLDGNTFTSSCC